MDVYLARQPIFDRSQSVIAYELLHRSGDVNYITETDGNLATSEVISSSMFNIGLTKLTRGKKAFINFTKKLLEDEIAFLLPKDLVGIEILEDVEADLKTYTACKKLSDRGYTILLDDFDLNSGCLDLLGLVDIVKIDFQKTDLLERAKIVQYFKGRKKRLLAEKVDTLEDYKYALENGYDYFQGYFFCKPSVVRSKAFPTTKIQKLRLLKEVYDPDMDFDKVADLIKQDPNFSYKLLRCINTLAYALRFQVNSIHQALVLLGQKEITKWASLICLHTISSDKPDELIITALSRARLCESIARQVGLKDQDSELFLTGLLSLLDTFFDQTMEELLKELPLADKVKGALLGDSNSHKQILEVAILYERGFLNEAFDLAKRAFMLDEKLLTEYYLESLCMADKPWD